MTTVFTPNGNFYLVSNVLALDPSAPVVDLDAHPWVPAVAIKDTDLMFEGKSLSSWFEAERSRRSSIGSNGSQGRSAVAVAVKQGISSRL
jgi:hypothetical protein